MRRRCCVATASSPSNAGRRGSTARTPSLRKGVRNHICVLLHSGDDNFSGDVLRLPLYMAMLLPDID